MVGRTVSHYRVLEKLGEGGMGVVYKAEDIRLGRLVALKFLPEGLSQEEQAVQRFQREARAASALNHANICTIYEVDEHEGRHFIAMELLEGQTLKQHAAAKALETEETVRLGVQVAEGLAAAHLKGIVHRDLKPANIFVTKASTVKVLDFGLAKLIQPAGDVTATASLTQAGVAPGTLPYMAPEQLRGRAVDVRTDIYALGCVLYEVATGWRPFREELGPRLIDDILHKVPSPASRLNPDLPLELERIIFKCLEKDPENRYQSAKEVGVDLRRLAAPSTVRAVSAAAPSRRRPALQATIGLLAVALMVGAYFARGRWWSAGSPPGGKIMLAVLPFENLSGIAEQEYFSDGLTEEMIAQLGALQPQRLGVIARTSAMRYKKTDKPIDVIGRELGVSYVLEGSVRRAGDRVRITAQLIQVSDQTHLWAENYERPITDVFTVQREVAERIADSLEVELLPAERARLVRRPVNPEAHEAYLRGRHALGQFTEEGIKRSLEYFQRATELDPQYAPAYAGMGDAYDALSWLGYMRPSEASPKAREAAEKALEIDPAIAEAYATIGFVKLGYEWDWAGAERAFKRALELDPGSPGAHNGYRLYASVMGRYAEAIAQLRQAQQLDPFSAFLVSQEGWERLSADEYDQAIIQFRKVLEMDPNYADAHTGIGTAYLRKGMYPQAIAEFQRALALSEGDPSVMAALAHASALGGKKQEAKRILEELKRLSKRRYLSPYFFAVVYGALGEKDEAFSALEESFVERFGYLTFVRVDPLLDPLRPDPRFQDLVHRMNFPE